MITRMSKNNFCQDDENYNNYTLLLECKEKLLRIHLVYIIKKQVNLKQRNYKHESVVSGLEAA